MRVGILIPPKALSSATAPPKGSRPPGRLMAGSKVRSVRLKDDGGLAGARGWVAGAADDQRGGLQEWIKLWNEAARRFTWTRTTGQIIDRICRYCSRISGPAH